MPRFAGLDRGAILRTAFPDLRVVDVTRRDRPASQSNDLNEAWLAAYLADTTPQIRS
jgi:hypothetical protein